MRETKKTSPRFILKYLWPSFIRPSRLANHLQDPVRVSFPIGAWKAARRPSVHLTPAVAPARQTLSLEAPAVLTRPQFFSLSYEVLGFVQANNYQTASAAEPCSNPSAGFFATQWRHQLELFSALFHSSAVRNRAMSHYGANRSSSIRIFWVRRGPKPMLKPIPVIVLSISHCVRQAALSGEQGSSVVLTWFGITTQRSMVSSRFLIAISWCWDFGSTVNNSSRPSELVCPCLWARFAPTLTMGSQCLFTKHWDCKRWTNALII